MIDDDLDYIASDEHMTDVCPGALVTLRGKLESVRWGRGGRLNAGHGDPSLVVTFSDWSMLAVNIRDEATARSISIPLSAHVCVRARTLDDGELEGIAIWQPGSVPIPRGYSAETGQVT